MAKYIKKPVVIEATQWWKNGDHPEDKCYFDANLPPDYLTEGMVVRYFRHPEISGTRTCEKCGDIMHNHGWIDTLEGGHIVCPGDWIITGVKGENYPIKDSIFRETYVPVTQKEESAEGVPKS